MSKHDDWFGCPNCGAKVPGGSLACPECGADDETGWSEDTAYDDLDLPGHAEPMADPSSGERMMRWGVVLLLLVVIGLVWVVYGLYEAG